MFYYNLWNSTIRYFCQYDLFSVCFLFCDFPLTTKTEIFKLYPLSLFYSYDITIIDLHPRIILSPRVGLAGFLSGTGQNKQLSHCWLDFIIFSFNIKDEPSTKFCRVPSTEYLRPFCRVPSTDTEYWTKCK